MSYLTLRMTDSCVRNTNPKYLTVAPLSSVLECLVEQDDEGSTSLYSQEHAVDNTRD